MARRKTPENETEEEKQQRHIKEQISNGPSRAEKVSWNRKRANLEALYEDIKPIEEEIIALIAKKQPIFDNMQEIREVMVDECIHPYDYLTVNEDSTVVCKFCNRTIKVLKK